MLAWIFQAQQPLQVFNVSLFADGPLRVADFLNRQSRYEPSRSRCLFALVEFAEFCYIGSNFTYAMYLRDCPVETRH